MPEYTTLLRHKSPDDKGTLFGLLEDIRNSYALREYFARVGSPKREKPEVLAHEARGRPSEATL